MNKKKKNIYKKTMGFTHDSQAVLVNYKNEEHMLKNFRYAKNWLGQRTSCT